MFSNALPPDHFLSQQRQGPARARHLGVVPDISTLAAHDFDVDVRTGFMPPDPPLQRLPYEWEAWEVHLDEAMRQPLQLGESTTLTSEEKAFSHQWRESIKRMPILPIEGLLESEVVLRRSHLVLAFLVHFYVHSLPPELPYTPINIPPSLSIPLLQISSNLCLPPVLTYSDTVLYNWTSPSTGFPDPSRLGVLASFTGTPSESEFYLTSARIELAGVAALSLLSATLDEMFVGDALSLQRTTRYIAELARVVDLCTSILADVRKGCDPVVFYDEIRPWFRGQGTRPWVFEGAAEAGLSPPEELSGSSAGQSTLIHALDVFLGIDEFSHTHVAGASTGPSLSRAEPSKSAAEDGRTPFLTRMQTYMPRHHRAFINHLKANPRPLRDLVVQPIDASASPAEVQTHTMLREAYNASVMAVKRFRDEHIRVATLYIVSMSKRDRTKPALDAHAPQSEFVERGTGGTDLVPFLKGIRDRTRDAVLAGNAEE